MALAAPDGNSTWSLYDGGTNTPEVAVHFDGVSVNRYLISAANQPVARCADGIYGVGRLAGEANVTKAATQGVVKTSDIGEPEMLNRLDRKPIVAGDTFVAAAPAHSVGHFGSNAACDADGNIIYLASNYQPSGRATFEVRTWNIYTGIRTTRILRHTDGTDVANEDRNPPLFGMMNRTLHDGQLMWLDPAGTVYLNDPATGKTSEAFTTSGASTLSTVDSLAHFDGPWLVVLEASPDLNKPMRPQVRHHHR